MEGGGGANKKRQRQKETQRGNEHKRVKQRLPLWLPWQALSIKGSIPGQVGLVSKCLGEIAHLICSFSVSVAARTSVSTDPSIR